MKYRVEKYKSESVLYEVEAETEEEAIEKVRNRGGEIIKKQLWELEIRIAD